MKRNFPAKQKSFRSWGAKFRLPFGRPPFKSISDKRYGKSWKDQRCGPVRTVGLHTWWGFKTRSEDQVHHQVAGTQGSLTSQKMLSRARAGGVEQSSRDPPEPGYLIVPRARSEDLCGLQASGRHRPPAGFADFLRHELSINFLHAEIYKKVQQKKHTARPSGPPLPARFWLDETSIGRRWPHAANSRQQETLQPLNWRSPWCSLQEASLKTWTLEPSQ